MLRRELLLASAALLGAGAGAKKARAELSTLVYSHATNVGPLHPHRYAPNQMFGQAMVYEPLVRYGEGGRIEPWLATAWSVSADGKTYTFTLRGDVTFSDGQGFDAAAVKANFDAVNAERGQHDWLELVAQIETVEAIDPRTVRLRLRDAYYPVLYDLALIRPLRFLSPAMLGRTAGEFAPVGTGPWKLVATARGQYDLFARNETYWGRRPGFDQVLVKVIPDPNTRALALETGAIDLVHGSDQLGSEAFLRFAADPRFHTGISPPLASRLLAINSSQGPTSELAVRRAILHAVNRASLVKNVLLDMEKPADTLFAQSFPYTDVPLEPIRHDQAAAARLLDEAGWILAADGTRAKDGRPLAFDLCFLGGDALHKALAEAIQGDLRKLGFQIRLVGEEEGSLVGRERSGAFGMLFADSWGAPYDPHTFMGSMRTPTHGDYQAQQGLPMKAEIDRRISQVLVSTDEAARRETYRWLLATLHEQAVYLPISYMTNRFVHRAGLEEVGFGATVNEIPFERMKQAA